MYTACPLWMVAHICRISRILVEKPPLGIFSLMVCFLPTEILRLLGWKLSFNLNSWLHIFTKHFFSDMEYAWWGPQKEVTGKVSRWPPRMSASPQGAPGHPFFVSTDYRADAKQPTLFYFFFLRINGFQAHLVEHEEWEYEYRQLWQSGGLVKIYTQTYPLVTHSSACLDRMHVK